MVDYLYIGIGGFIGTILRYLMSLIPLKNSAGFPLNTLLINVLGSFAIGLIVALGIKYNSISPRMMLLLRIGVCGGFTTFSTFCYEVVSHMKSGSFATALAYVILSVIFGVGAILLAEILVR